MHSEERRRQIASLTAVHGRVTVLELAHKFEVTPETIRRDLSTLEEQGAVHRTHGGAVPSNNFQTQELSLHDRQKAAPQAKYHIALKALEFLPEPHSHIFLDAGTTTTIFAKTLANTHQDRHYSITTNCLPTSIILADAGMPNVQLLGGTVRPVAQSVVGDIALRSLGIQHASTSFIGANALTLEHGLSTADSQEAALKRAMIANSDRVIVLCDSTKFGRDYLVSFASLNQIDTLITDSEAPERYIRILKDHGVNIVVAD